MTNSSSAHFFESYESKVTRLICRILRYIFFALPVLALATWAGVYNMELSYFIFAIPLGFVGTHLPTLLLKLKVAEKVVKYVAVVSVGLVIGMLSIDANLNLHLTFLLMPTVAVIYFDRKLVIQSAIIGWLILAAGFFLRSSGRVLMEVAERTAMEWFIDQLIGFSLEYVIVSVFLIAVAGRARGLMENLSETMAESINTGEMLVDDITKFSHEANINGDIEYRIDAEKYSGKYKEMIENLNKFTDDFVGDMLAFLDAMNRVNKGDFRSELNRLPGKKIILNNTLDELMTNLNAVHAEVNGLIEAASAKGDLSFKINADKYQGNWRELMLGLNSISEAVDIPLQAINVALREMQSGYFDTTHLLQKIEEAGLPTDPAKYRGVFGDIIMAVNATMAEISSYVTEISENLIAMADGNMTTVISRDYVGNFMDIKESFNNISATLNKTLSEISAASDQVLSGAKQISTSAMDLANGATEQASSVQELTASIDMINQQTMQNANNAQEANTLSNRSTENANEGNEAMKQMLDAMHGIKEASGNISKIIKTIQDIAFQTNLLALNASVEAARAGEHGKGFSVVADEVRTLAGRSQNAAEETTALIEDSINRVDAGSGIAESTANALGVIVTNTQEMLRIIDNISVSSKEQAEAIGQVGVGLGQISSVTQSNSAVSEEAAAAAEELTSQAEILRQLVAYFKL
jgi:methyl-accepting chemotaxis protein